ncbi:hypothetical protein Q604_UNBC17851G0001, partial [human gut metagenome]
DDIELVTAEEVEGVLNHIRIMI